MNDFFESLLEQWEDLSTEDQAYLNKRLALIPAQFIAYKVYRKLGAPKWAAWGIAAVSTNVSLAPDRFAYEQRKRVRDLGKTRD